MPISPSNSGPQFHVTLHDADGNLLYHHTDDGLDSPQIATVSSAREAMEIAHRPTAFTLADEDNGVFEEVPVAESEVRSDGTKEVYHPDQREPVRTETAKRARTGTWTYG